MMERLKACVIEIIQLFTVQYHPDAAPGPHDGLHLFDEFMELMDAWKEQN